MVVWKWFPETRGLTLEDMGRVFGDAAPLPVAEGDTDDAIETKDGVFERVAPVI